MQHRAHRALCVAGLLLGPILSAQDSKPPSRSETQKLCREYLKLDGRTAEGHARRVEILARIDLLKPLRPREVTDWKKKLLKEHKKLRKLQKKSGEHWFWEPDKGLRTGRYFVGGEIQKPKALLIGMHGGGVGSGDASSSHRSYAPAAKDLGWVSICPEVLAKTELGWTDSGTAEFVLELVDCALRTWKLDPNRVYFTGHSMGGYGTWTLGAHHADRVAGLAPSAGAPTPIFGPGGDIVDLVEGVIPSLRNVRMVVFQSTDDPRVPPGPNQKAIELVGLARAKWGGFECEYWEVADRGHGFPVGGAKALIEKMGDWDRNPVPERITWQPVVRWKRQFYWLYWEDLYTEAVLVADVDRESNTISIQCPEAAKRAGLSVLLDDRIVDMKADVAVRLNDVEVWRGRPQPTLSTLLLTAVRNDPGLMFTARVPVVAGQ